MPDRPGAAAPLVRRIVLLAMAGDGAGMIPMQIASVSGNPAEVDQSLKADVEGQPRRQIPAMRQDRAVEPLVSRFLCLAARVLIRGLLLRLHGLLLSLWQ